MENLIAFFFASVLLTISPGPDLLMVVTQSLESGFRSAFKFILGLLTGLLMHTLLLSFGWAQFVGERPTIILWLKIIGCVYFLYLGFRSILSYFSPQNTPAASYVVSEKPYQKGLIMNLINPKVSLFFWLFFPAFLFDAHWSAAMQYLVLGLVFALQALMVFSLVAFFSAKLTAEQRPAYLKLFTGFVLMGIGCYIALG